MPDRHSSDGTAMVALRRAAAKGSEHATSPKPPESAQLTPSHSRGRSCVGPLNIGVCGVSALEDDLSSATSKLELFHAPSPRSPHLQGGLASTLETARSTPSLLQQRPHDCHTPSPTHQRHNRSRSTHDCLTDTQTMQLGLSGGRAHSRGRRMAKSPLTIDARRTSELQ